MTNAVALFVVLAAFVDGLLVGIAVMLSHIRARAEAA